MVIANGLDSASTGLPSTNCTWPSGLCASSYFPRSAITLTWRPSYVDRRTVLGPYFPAGA